jgi:hypothetical protein
MICLPSASPKKLKFSYDAGWGGMRIAAAFFGRRDSVILNGLLLRGVEGSGLFLY